MDAEFWNFVRQHLGDDEPVFLAFVAHNTRHSPGTAGARIAIAQDGTTFGTIGGGVMEADLLIFAKKSLQSGDFSPQAKTLHHRRKLPPGSDGALSGLGCAGSQTNVYYLATPDEDLSTVEEITKAAKNDASAIFTLSTGGLSISDAPSETLQKPFHFESGQNWRFSALLFNWKRIAILGGGHCGLALSKTMHHLGYRVTIVDNRPDVFTFRENSFADHRLTVDDYADAGPQIAHTQWTHVAVMTANIDDDIRALLGVAELPFPYIGVMGAPAKLTRIKSELTDLGISQKTLDRLYAPIGLPMTSNTPEEIAISIAAEILRERPSLFPHP